MESDDISIGSGSLDHSSNNSELLENNEVIDEITDSSDNINNRELNCEIRESSIINNGDGEDLTDDYSDDDNTDEEEENDSSNNDENLDDDDDDDDDWESMDEDDDISRIADKNINSDLDSDSSNDLSERCPICLNRFLGQTIGSPDSCDHNFCLECLQEWTKNINTCPVDRKLYNQIISRHELGGNIIEKIPVESTNKDDTIDDVTYCEICGLCDREDRLLLCDHCDEGYHCECLTPPLEHIPVTEWYCPNCTIFGEIEEIREENSNVNIRQPISSRSRRAIARTRASESVRFRIQQRRRNSRRNTHRGKRTRKRKTRRGKKTLKSAKKQNSKKSTSTKKKTRKPKQKKIKKRRKTKTKRALAAARRLAAPTVRKRIAEKLGIQKPLPGHLLPQIRKPCLSRFVNVHQYDNGISTVSLFGNRNDLDIISEDYENDGGVGLMAVYPRIRDQLISVHNAKIADIPNSLRRNSGLTPLIARENIDVLGNIMQEQTFLYYKSSDVYIGRNGVLNVKPSDGLEDKQEPESSNKQGKIIQENSQKNNSSNKSSSLNYGQSSSSVASSSIDLFDSDVNENFNDSSKDVINKPSGNQTKSNQPKSKKKNSGKLFGALNLIELYSDIEDDDNPETIWGSGKKDFKEENANNKENTKGVVSSQEHEKNKSEKSIEKSDKSFSDQSEEIEKIDQKSSDKTDFISTVFNKMNMEKKKHFADNEQIDEKNNLPSEDKKEEQTDEIPDDFTDVTPRVNISILPKIPKIKRERLDDKQNEETSNNNGRSSVLSRLDDGSSDTKWNKRSRFNRDKNSVENKSQSEKSFHGHDNSRSKSDHYRWSDDRNSRDNRNWRERDNDHFRDRNRHMDRRDYDRWDRSWRSDQRNDYENSGYMNDHRKKYPRDNRNNFRDRKDNYSRGKSTRSPLRDFTYDKERNFGSKNNINERGNIHREISNRNYHKKFSYDDDDYEFKRHSPDRQSRNFETKKNQNESYMNRSLDHSSSDTKEPLLKEPLLKEPLLKEPLLKEPLLKEPLLKEPLLKEPLLKEPLLKEPLFKDPMANDQKLHEDLTNYGSSQNVSLPTKRKGTPIEWEEKQKKIDDDQARFWENEDNERLQSKSDNNEDKNNNTSDFNLMSSSPPSPSDKESYDPFDPTESPKVTGSKDSKSSTLDIPLPDKSDQEQKNETSVVTSFSQTSFDQTSTSMSTLSVPTLPNVHVPPPNYIIHSVPRTPFGNMVSQPGMQPFNWPTPPPTILMPPILRGNFIPPPIPPRMMGPPNSQTQMNCLPPSGPMPPVMGHRGPSNTGPLIPNLPPPPMPNLNPMTNLPHQITLTNIHHPPPPPPPPPPLLGNTNQTSINNNIVHPMINAVPVRNQLFVPVTTTQVPQEQTLSVNANQISTNLHSPLQSSTNLPVQTSITTSNITVSSTVSENMLTNSQTKTVSSKNNNNNNNNNSNNNNNNNVNRIVSSSSETSLKSSNSEGNQSVAPLDVTEVVDMEVESPFSPTNSPLDFDDMSLASSDDKSTPSPISKDDHSNIISSPKLRSHSTSKLSVENIKSGTKVKSDKSSSNGKVTSTNKSSKSVVTCGESLLEEVWAKHILGESPPSKNKNAKTDTKKRPTEKIRVVRNFSGKKNSQKSESGSSKMDEDQLKILDEIPSSAVEMQVKEKYLKKLNRQERVVEEVKLALKPYYNRREIDKDEYKDILRKCVPKVCHNRSGSIIPKKIKALVEAYIEKLSHDRKKGKTKHFSNT